MVAISTDFMSFLSHSVSESLADLQGTSASQAFSCQVGLPQSQEKKKKIAGWLSIIQRPFLGT